MASRFRFLHSHGSRLAGTTVGWSDSRWFASQSSGPLATYKLLVQRGELQSGDVAQEKTVVALEKLHRELLQTEETRWWHSVTRWRQPPTTSGLYMHGTVGTGKTFLMDLFYSQSPVHRKRRTHFHSFMLDVHKRLHEHGRSHNAVEVVALQLLEQAHLLCLDEVEVTDIADALMLKRLFEILWPMGIIIIATSNSAPDELYRNGLNRSLFLPFIRQLKEYCNVYSLNSANGIEYDYRRRHSRLSHLYLSPLVEAVDGVMDQIFLFVTGGVEGMPRNVVVAMGRLFHILAAKDVARASFSYLCESAFGAADYIAIAENFRVLLLDRIPQLGDIARENEARRFITLVDVLYESNTILICSAAVPPDLLFVDPSQFSKTVEKDTIEGTDNDKLHVLGEGGSSGRSTLMIGNMEWSATGRHGASLASLAGTSFTQKAAPRAVSRLLEMQTDAYIARNRKSYILAHLEKLNIYSSSSSQQ